ncbi:glycosyltransferase 87 family protein [Salinilacihabitans rarus]|uniref:glycosyltransferase 87 family protein n=1 Tax=Salinilacihabitans rarus TaxID=2961596 RepID=UPI0020C866AB|nr:glycosyltransferase 87 family protein [Salinilacihabitans rarus]
MTRRDDDPDGLPSVTGARAVLASGVFLGVLMFAYRSVERPHMLAANFAVYRVAAEAALAGADFYAVAPAEFPHFFYLYPPITVVQFLPFAFVGLWTGFAVHLALEVGAGLALAAVIVRRIERRRPLATVDRALIAGFVVGSIHTVPSLFYGQVNLRMALLVALGLALLAPVDARREGRLDRETLAGVALAGAALLKVFPAAIGVWLLRLRAGRAVAGALATGLGGLGLGALVFGREATRTYVFDALLPRTDSEAFVGGLDPGATYVTVRRPLSVLLPSIDPGPLSVLAAVVLLPALAYVYTDVETPVDRLVGAHATLLAIFVYFPSYPLYYVFLFGTLVPTLYLVSDRSARRLLVAGALLANVVVNGGSLESLAAALPDVGEPLVAVAMPALALSTPVLAGCLCMLTGCVVHRYRRVRRPDREPATREDRGPERSAS